MLGVTDEVAREILALEEAQRRLTVRERAREDFLAFVRQVRVCQLPVAGMAYWPQSRIKNHPDHAYGGTGGTVWP